ncbi:MAG: FIST N-terminal domain-containing protein, partial [Patescibacteria group bacterium]
MSIKAGVGLSKNKNSSQAGFEAAKFALKQCGEENADFIVVFSSSSFDQRELMKGLKEAIGNTSMAGCTSAGEITNEGPFTKSVVVMAIKSDSLRFFTG